MSIIGTKIFSDEYAAIVRDEYRTLIGFGFPDEEAERLVINYFIDGDNKTETAATFWLALSLAQWNVGRLSDHVKERAIDVIDSGFDLIKWEKAIEYETKFATDKKIYNFSIINDLMEQTQLDLSTATGIERVKKMEEMQNLKDLHSYCTVKSDIAEKAQPIPPVIKDEPYLFDILMINGKARKKYEKRKEELKLLRLKLMSPQTFKKVAKPYFTPSPWDEGDIVTIKLKGLIGDIARFNDHWVIFPILCVKKKPVSRIIPQLATNDEVTVGLFNFMNTMPPSRLDIEKAQYIPFRIFKDTDTKGIWLSFYSAKKEINQWQWQVQAKNPGFAQALPEFYQSGSIGMVIVSFGNHFAEVISKSILALN